MMSDALMQAVIQAIDDSGALLLFAGVLMTGYGTLLLAMLFGALALRAAWRWLKQKTWSSLVLALERRAVRSR